jgi:hypothetical protein
VCLCDWVVVVVDVVCTMEKTRFLLVYGVYESNGRRRLSTTENQTQLRTLPFSFYKLANALTVEIVRRSIQHRGDSTTHCGRRRRFVVGCSTGRGVLCVVVVTTHGLRLFGSVAAALLLLRHSLVFYGVCPCEKFGRRSETQRIFSVRADRLTFFSLTRFGLQNIWIGM